VHVPRSTAVHDRVSGVPVPKRCWQHHTLHASEWTLEVAAVTGEFGSGRWPSSETFIFGFNISSACIGGVLAIPPHGDGAVFTVSVRLALEQILFGGGVVPQTASPLLATFRGNPDLALRGTALGWSRTGPHGCRRRRVAHRASSDGGRGAALGSIPTGRRAATRLNRLRDVATHPNHLGLVFRAPSTCQGVLPLVCRPVWSRS
jgi:hypothetical protein